MSFCVSPKILLKEIQRQTIEQPKRASGGSFASVVTWKRPSLNRARKVRLLTLELTSPSLANWPGRSLRLPGGGCQVSESTALRRVMMTVFMFPGVGVSVVFLMIVRVSMPGN